MDPRQLPGMRFLQEIGTIVHLAVNVTLCIVGGLLQHTRPNLHSVGDLLVLLATARLPEAGGDALRAADGDARPPATLHLHAGGSTALPTPPILQACMHEVMLQLSFDIENHRIKPLQALDAVREERKGLLLVQHAG